MTDSSYAILALMFPAYVEKPGNYCFEGQDSGEEILLLLRAHPITNIPWIFFSIILFMVPFIVLKAAPYTGFNLMLIPQNFILILLIINYLLVLIIVFEGFLNWYFNATLITNEKVIDIDFEHLLYKAVNLAPLSKIEETNSVVAGIIGTIFNFGNVRIQTAGENISIEMKNIPRPALVSDLILDLIHKQHAHIAPGS